MRTIILGVIFYLVGSIAYAQLSGQGITMSLPMNTTLTTGNCIKATSPNTIGDAGAACGTGTGTITGVTAGVGMSGGGSSGSVTVTSNAEGSVDFQPGLLTAVTNTKGVYGKFVKTSTVDNIVASALLFSCVSNPTLTFFECGTTATCDSSPTTIGTVTVTAAGIATNGTINSAAVTAGDYVAWAITAGTCTSLDISANAQVHSN